MKRHLLGLRGALLAVGLVLGCKGDPTAGLVGGVATVQASLTYVTVNVGDSVLVSAAVRDAAGNPVPVAATLTSTSTAIASVATVVAAPLDYTNFFLKGVAYGTTTIVVAAGNAVDTIHVHTYPASVKITGSVDSLGSGATRQMAITPLDAAGNTIAVADTFTWSSSNAAVLSVDQKGLVTAASPGKATISLVGPGSPNSVTTSVDIPVKPGAFTGTLSSATGAAGAVITVTKAASDPAFDADVGASVGGVTTFVTAITANTIQVIVPALGKTGSAPLLITNIGANQLARLAAFTSSSAAVTDPNSPVGDTPGTPLTIAANGDFFTILHGTCNQGGDIEGGTESAGDKCDTYWTITNNTGAATTLKLQMDWFDGAAAGSDIDLIVCKDTTCTGSFNFGGATAANPEKTSVVMPAGATWRIVPEMFDNVGLSAILVRVRLISGLP